MYIFMNFYDEMIFLPEIKQRWWQSVRRYNSRGKTQGLIEQITYFIAYSLSGSFKIKRKYCNSDS